MNENKEVDHLKYVGNQIPRFIRLAWTIFLVFGLYYLAAFMWPDLKTWISALT